MADFDTVRVAAVQATPVILDAEATVDRAIELFVDAVDDGARLVVFPECFVSLYPSGVWAAAVASWGASGDALWERLWASSLDVRGLLVQRLFVRALSATRSWRSASTSARTSAPDPCTTLCSISVQAGSFIGTES